jgi:hypothetical protein
MTSIPSHIASLYRRTMDGADCETACALVGTVRLRVVRWHHIFNGASLVIEDRDTPEHSADTVTLARLVLPRHGVRSCGPEVDAAGDADDIADEVQEALPRIAGAALAIIHPDGSSRLQSAGVGLDALGLLARIYRECAASQVEAERLEQVAAAELDGGAA